MIRFLRQALRNLEEIHVYYATCTIPGHAYEVIADIRAQIERLAWYPAYGRPGKKVNTRELVLRRFPYSVIYRVEGENVIILRVQDTRRRS